MEHYIVSTGDMDGALAKIAQLKNIYNCNTVYVDEIVVTNFSDSDLSVQVLKNVESAGVGAVSKKGTSTDFSNNCPSKATLNYNEAFNELISPTAIIFDLLSQPGNLAIKFKNPIILKPGNSISVLLTLDGVTDYTASVKFEFDESSSCACCFCC